MRFDSSLTDATLLYTLVPGEQAFCILPDGSALIARRALEEQEDLPLWLLSIRDRFGHISSLSPVKGALQYASTEEVLALAARRGGRTWHVGPPPPPRTTQPLPAPPPLDEASSPPSEEASTAASGEPPPVSSSPEPSPAPEREGRFRAAQTSIDRLAKARAAEIQQIAAAQIELDNVYIREALAQGQQGFQLARSFAPWGVAFIALLTFAILFLAAIGRLSASAAFASLLGSLAVEGIPTVGFFLYYQAAKQFREFSLRLDRRHRYLLANSIIVTSLQGPVRDQSLQQLLDAILQDSPLNLEAPSNQGPHVPLPRLQGGKTALSQ